MMKKHLRLVLFCMAFAIICGGAFEGFAQTEPPMVGGYGSVAVTDAQVLRAANFAVKKQAKTQKAKIKLAVVSRAEQQVVAGMNYRLCLQVEVLEKGKKTAVPQTVQTVVFQDLKQKLELTSWAVAACTEAMPPETPKE